MQTLQINIQSKKTKYDVLLGSSILNELEKTLLKHKSKKKVVIIDFSVKNHFEEKLMKILKKFNPLIISVLATEEAKSRKTKQEIEDTMFQNNCGRDTLLIGIGGGIIGDLTGYIAATFNRGISYIHMPTTLLAMVDSSIGGKTGINTKKGKNLIGAIWQPTVVFCDLDFLATLSDEEIKNGLAEIIKIASILDKNLFSFIEKNHKKIMQKDSLTMFHIIKISIELKKQVVEADERESGFRQVLNFGHTIGHALENYFEYKKKHGVCVSLGMIVEAKISRLLNELNEKEELKLVNLLEKIGLPTQLQQVNRDKLIKLMKSDKKSVESKPRFILLKEIGKIKSDKTNFSFEVKEDIIKKALK